MRRTGTGGETRATTEPTVARGGAESSRTGTNHPVDGGATRSSTAVRVTSAAGTDSDARQQASSAVRQDAVVQHAWASAFGALSHGQRTTPDVRSAAMARTETAVRRAYAMSIWR
jgi:hypothetical protein